MYHPSDIEEDLDKKSQRVALLASNIKGCERTIEALKLAHQRPWHPAMVPLGSVAYAPGRLVDTNNVTVYLGDGYFVEKTNSGAQKVLLRRTEKMENQKQLLEKEIEELKESLQRAGGATLRTTDEGFVDIREPIDDEADQGVAILHQVPETENATAAEDEKAVEEQEFEEFWDSIPASTQSSSSVQGSNEPPKPNSQLQGFFAKTAKQPQIKESPDVISQVVERSSAQSAQRTAQSQSSRPVSKFRAARQKK